MITIILLSAYGLISILIGFFVSKVILDPISKLIDSVPRIASGENVYINDFSEGKKKTQVDEITNAFSVITNELRENLNEVEYFSRKESVLNENGDQVIKEIIKRTNIRQVTFKSYLPLFI